MTFMRWFGTAAILLLAGCATMEHAPHASVVMMTPAESNEAARIKQVAVLPFDGYQGREFSTEIQALLAGVRLGDKPYFQVVDRSMLDRIYAEIRLSQSGSISHDQALRLGKLLGVRGLYTGTQGVSDTNQTGYQEKRSVCADGSKTDDLLSTLACKKFIDTTVYCTQHEASYTFSAKLINAETGQIVYARTIPGHVVARSCPDQQQPPDSSAQLIEAAKQQAFETFLRDVAPSFRTVDVQLLDSTSNIESESARTKLEQGIAFATANRLDRACELWTEAKASAGQSPALYYDLGVCAESRGDIDGASDLYKQADHMLSKPDDRISLALLRTEKAKRDTAKFALQVQR